MAARGVESQMLKEPVKRLELDEFCIVTRDTSIRETVERMQSRHTHCAFIVGEKTRLVGILTERDVLKKVVNHPEIWDNAVETIMTTSPQTLPSTATTGDALRIMDKHKFRNVPVIGKDNTIIGNITHFALMDYLVAHFPEAVYNLPPDPQNYADQRDGG